METPETVLCAAFIAVSLAVLAVRRRRKRPSGFTDTVLSLVCIFASCLLVEGLGGVPWLYTMLAIFSLMANRQAIPQERVGAARHCVRRGLHGGRHPAVHGAAIPVVVACRRRGRGGYGSGVSGLLPVLGLVCEIAVGYYIKCERRTIIRLFVML